MSDGGVGTIDEVILVQWERCDACGDCIEACVEEMARQRAPYPHLPRLFIARGERPAYVALCRQCAEAPCLDACISGAIRRSDEGVVVLAEDVCVGCWMCLTHCPFGALTAVGEVALKCNLCTPSGVVPPCVRVCPQGALALGSAEPCASLSARAHARALVESRWPL